MLFDPDPNADTSSVWPDRPVHQGRGGLDPLARQGADVPDHVPDDLLTRYGREAGQKVRYRRSQRYRASRGLHDAVSTLRDSDVWMLAVMIFFWLVAGAAAIGAIVYAISLWPWFGAYVLVPLVGLFILSLGLAAKLAKKRQPQDDEAQ